MIWSWDIWELLLKTPCNHLAGAGGKGCSLYQTMGSWNTESFQAFSLSWGYSIKCEWPVRGWGGNEAASQGSKNLELWLSSSCMWFNGTETAVGSRSGWGALFSPRLLPSNHPPSFLCSVQLSTFPRVLWGRGWLLVLAGGWISGLSLFLLSPMVLILPPNPHQHPVFLQTSWLRREHLKKEKPW